MNTALVLSLDIGTSSTRALLFDARGQKIGSVAQRPYAQTTTPDGGVETNADELLNLTLQCVDEVLQSHNDAEFEIIAVATSCFWHSLMAVDANGEALIRVLSWADNRAAPWIPALRSLLDEESTHARTGCVFHTSYWPAKLLWLSHASPELFESEGARWMSFGEYIALKLTGAAHCSISMASGTGIFDQNKCDWDDEVLNVLPIGRAQLSTLCDAGDALPPLDAEYSARWPQLQGAKWYPALGDGACSNIGTGGVDDSCLVLNAGTSGALRVVLPEYSGAAPRGLWRYRVDKNRSVMGGAISNVGNVLLWATQTLKLPDDWREQISALQPEVHGLLVLPFLAGERSPLWNANAKFCLDGATLGTTPIEILRACLEASALRFAAIAELVLEGPAQKSREILFSGGALEAAPVWAQIVCDAIGLPLVKGEETEASARGAALMALEACGAIESISHLPAERGNTLAPDAGNHEIYRRALEKQNALYANLYPDHESI
jgi:gluconokinase